MSGPLVGHIWQSFLESGLEAQISLRTRDFGYPGQVRTGSRTCLAKASGIRQFEQDKSKIFLDVGLEIGFK
jgi:hypothetical protein